MNQTQRFLREANRRIREQRPPVEERFQIRAEPDASPPFGIIWFASRGCAFDRAGDCVTCNYGHATHVADPVESVRLALAEWQPPAGSTLMISPSGSMFDDAEVPATTRDAIFALAAATDCACFGCETRVETIDERKLEDYCRILGHKQPFLELGVESANPFVLKYCLNKATDVSRYRPAVQSMERHGITAVANVSLGAPFLTPAQAIDDAVTTIRWAIAQGFAQIVLFPLHVKRWTLLEWMWRQGLYQPPSLWSVVEVLGLLTCEERQKVTVGWYDGDQEPETSRRLLLHSPTTCPDCRPRVLDAIDRFAKMGDNSRLAALAGGECACRVSPAEDWPGTVPDRALTVYDGIGHDLIGDAAWSLLAEQVRTELLQDWERQGQLGD